MTNKLNDAPVLDQLDEQWQNMTALLLHKLVPKGESISISMADMEAMMKDWPTGATILCVGQHDGFLFKLISMEEADVAAAHHAATHGGGARHDN